MTTTEPPRLVAVRHELGAQQKVTEVQLHGAVAITSDLRCALALLIAHDRGLEVAHPAADALDALRRRTATEQVRRRDLRDVRGWHAAAESSGDRQRQGDRASMSVRTVEVVSESREITHH